MSDGNMDRAEQLTRELYFVHKSGDHSVAYAVARIIALEALLRDVLESQIDMERMTEDLMDRIEKLLPKLEETDDDES